MTKVMPDMRQVAIWAYRAAGAGLAIALMEALAQFAEEPVVRIPFVTSIVLTLALPESEPAQPYALIAGHLLSTLAGLVALWCLGPGTTAAAVGVGLATLLMLAARALHPPAGIDGFLVPLLGLPSSWMLNPVLCGAVMLAVYSRLWALGEKRLLHRRL